MKDYKNIKNKLLKNKEINKEYKKLSIEFALIKKIIEERIKKGITQKDLALKLGTKQSAISRFESGRYNPSLSFIVNISEVLGLKMKLK